MYSAPEDLSKVRGIYLLIIQTIQLAIRLSEEFWNMLTFLICIIYYGDHLSVLHGACGEAGLSLAQQRRVWYFSWLEGCGGENSLTSSFVSPRGNIKFV